jgi:hypothetical protein
MATFPAPGDTHSNIEFKCRGRRMKLTSGIILGMVVAGVTTLKQK